MSVPDALPRFALSPSPKVTAGALDTGRAAGAGLRGNRKCRRRSHLRITRSSNRGDGQWLDGYRNARGRRGCRCRRRTRRGGGRDARGRRHFGCSTCREPCGRLSAGIGGHHCRTYRTLVRAERDRHIRKDVSAGSLTVAVIVDSPPLEIVDGSAVTAMPAAAAAPIAILIAPVGPVVTPPERAEIVAVPDCVPALNLTIARPPESVSASIGRIVPSDVVKVTSVPRAAASRPAR